MRRDSRLGRLALLSGMLVGAIAGTLARPFRNATPLRERIRPRREPGRRSRPRKFGNQAKDPVEALKRMRAAKDKRARRQHRNILHVLSGGYDDGSFLNVLAGMERRADAANYNDALDARRVQHGVRGVAHAA